MDNDPAPSRRTIGHGNRKHPALFRPPSRDTTGSTERAAVTTVTAAAIQHSDDPPKHSTRCGTSHPMKPENPMKKALEDAHVGTRKLEDIASKRASPLQQKRNLRSKCGVCGQFGHGVDACPRKNTKKEMPIVSTTTSIANEPVGGSVSYATTGNSRAKVVVAAPTADKKDEWKAAFINRQIRSKMDGNAIPRVPRSGIEFKATAKRFSALDKAAMKHDNQKNVQNPLSPFNRVLYLRNLTADASDDQVRNEFLRGFDIVDFLRSTNALNGVVYNKGWAYMASRDETEKARIVLNGRNFMGMAVSVEFIENKRCPKVTKTGFVHTPTVLPAILRDELQEIVPDLLPDVSLGPHMRIFTGNLEVLPNAANKQCHIIKWLASLPKNSLQFLEPSSHPAYHTSLYQDWFLWSTTRGRILLHELDKYETQHRAIGLKYHMLPYDLRHATTHKDGAKVSQQAVARLAGVYETNIPYNVQLLYRDWVGVVNAVRMVVEEVQRVEGSTDTQVLGETHEYVVSLLDLVEKKIQRIFTSLHGMNQLVETLRTRRTAGPKKGDDEATKRLKDENTNEGRFIRRWVWTWAEVHVNVGSGTPAQVEELVRGLLGRGAEMCTFWRNSVP